MNRFATSNGHLVATTDPVKNAIRSIEVQENENEKVFFVELTKHSKDKLPHEIARFDEVAVVKKPVSTLHNGHFHNLINPLEYWEAIHQLEQTFRPHKNIPNSNKLLTELPKITLDSEYLKSKLMELSGASPIKLGEKKVFLKERYSKEGKKLAREFLEREYTSLGYQVREHEFGQFFSGVNFIAEKKGSTRSYYMITSHYDTVRTVGADDDGSGVIASLAIAKALKDMNSEFGIRFVAFDLEERGLKGSKAYADLLNSQSDLEHMAGLIQLEMLGWDEDNDRKFHVIDCNENTSPELTRIVLETIKHLKLNLSQSSACTNRSDHAPFWRYNKPAIVISQNFFGGDSNPCYHRSCDNYEKINLDYLLEIATATANAAAKLIRVF